MGEHRDNATLPLWQLFREGYESGLADQPWQDIATAPRDGTLFLAYKCGAMVVGKMAKRTLRAGSADRPVEKTEDCFEMFPGGLSWNPTHWMKLPAPPAAHPGDGR